MAQLVNLVVYDTAKVDEVIHAWVEAGVNGLTILDSSGLSRAVGEYALRDDVPLFPSIRRLLRESETHSRMIFSVVPDDFDVDGLIAATEKIIGSLEEEETGILYVVALKRVAGLKRRRDKPDSSGEETMT